jgi:3-oxoacyl-[acyl-carrier-protein] synthase-3
MSEIIAIEYHLPDRVSTAADLSTEFPEWSAEQIAEKTGIVERHLAADGECSSDLAVHAATKLFASGACSPSEVDFVLFCTQSPDYFLPTTACLLQDRLHIPTTAGALDFNLGCSGFIYGLGLAEGLIESKQASSVLLLTAETYSKFIHPADKSVRTIFGDAAAATLVQGSSDSKIGPFVYGTDGRGGENLIVKSGGMRTPRSTETAAVTKDDSGNQHTEDHLFMDGPEIFNFTLGKIPAAVAGLLAKTGKSLEDVDFFVFHQANRYMLEHLRKKLRIPSDKFCVSLKTCGNTVSSTIPIALKASALEGKLKDGDLVMLLGFGVGYSWGATFLRWSSRFNNDGTL